MEPIQSKITILSAIKREHQKGNTMRVVFEYEGEKYISTYNYTNSYGYKFISESYGGKTIYSSTQPELTTELGAQLELTLSKMEINYTQNNHQ